MANFGKADKTGRSSGRLSAPDRAKFGMPPPPWIPLPRALLISEAWRGQSRHCRLFLDFLMAESQNHAGRDNGRLLATYNQLQAFGLSRKRIPGAIREAMERGLVDRTQKGGAYGLDNHRTPSLYRLTWMGCLEPANYATNEWKKFQGKKNSRPPKGGTAPAPSVGTHSTVRAEETAA